MDPATLAMAGAAIGGGTSLAGGILNSVGNYHTNKALMEQEMLYNANEARKQREWQSAENSLAYSRNSSLQNQQFLNQQVLDRQARDWQSNANKIAMDWSSKEAQAQRDFQSYYASNAHQIEMEDLRKAGLNPILAASLNGASIPNGASGQAFSTSPSGSSASSASVGVGSASSARVGSRAVHQKPFDALTDFIGNYLSNAKKVTQMANKYDSDDDFYKLAVRRAFKDLK